MTEFKTQKSLLIQHNDDGSYLVAVGTKTFEGTNVSVNIHIGTTYIMGFDNPSLFEIYEDMIFDVDIEIEPDESISVDVGLMYASA